ncbi:MAG: histidinol-phosphate transaminase [Myxococcales bacterium]|nr:histidinol-phosphate transaminase [Myxococcales bacterium]
MDPLRFVRPDVVALEGYVPGAQRADALKLNTNECAWPASPRVAEAVQAVVDGLVRYPDPLATALRVDAARHYGVTPEQVLAGNGSDDCLTMLFRAHLAPGDVVAAPDPTYGLYRTLAGVQGARYVGVPYGEGWAVPDLAATGARLALVAHPNNPSGTLAEVDALRRLADRLEGVLVVDEAYVDFAEAARGPCSLIPYLGAHPNLVVLRTFSKSFGLAGARLGLLFAHPALVAQYAKVKDSYNVDSFAQAAGRAALADTAHHRDVVARTLDERARLAAALAAFGWTFPDSDANFLLCHVGPDAERLYRALGDEGVLVRWWSRPDLRACLRISVGRPEHTDRLLDALRRHGAAG